MSEPGFYRTIEKETFAEYKDRGSKFIAYTFPIKSADDFKTHLQKIKKAHPKAVHHCFAYKIGHDGNNFRLSDDGEPSGTAGKPIMGQIESKNITDVLIIVVRYFGGTLLGVPGLINAYKTATSLALQLCPIVTKPILNLYEIQFDYTVINDVQMCIKQFKGEVVRQDLQLFCNVLVGVPVTLSSSFLEKLSKQRQVAVKSVK